MARVARRLRRTLTPAERARMDQAYAEVEHERDELIAEARRAKLRSVALRATCRMLRAERQAQGLSLADLSARTGITRSSLCRLETAAQPNPTINTLQRVAEALGRELVVTLK
jgi:DNA-binding phage protein